MTYKADMKWHTGKEIDSFIDQKIFELNLSEYTWTKTLSILPRRCYVTKHFIRPFTYAMVAKKKVPWIDDPMAELEYMDSIKKDFPNRWVSMPRYIWMQLKDEV